MASSSVYGFYAMAVIELIIVGVLLALLIGIGLIACTKCHCCLSGTSRWRVIGCLVTFMGACCIFAVVNPVSFGQLPLSAGIVLCVLLSAVFALASGFLLGPALPSVVRGITTADGTKEDCPSGNALKKYGQQGSNREGGGGDLDDIERGHTTNGREQGDEEMSECEGEERPQTKEVNTSPPSRSSVLLADVKQRRHHYSLFFLGYIVLSFLLLLVTYGACYCGAPNELTTWVSRSAQQRVCHEDQVCYTYATLGSNCTNLLVMSHVILSSPHTATAVSGRLTTLNDYLRVSQGNPLTTSSLSPGLGGKNVTGNIIDMSKELDEDRRFVGELFLDGLEGDTSYALEIAFVVRDKRSGNSHPVAHTFFVHSVPCGPLSRLQFIGGGDYKVGGAGKQLIRTALEMTPGAAFVWIGGDLSYANNMRTCYRRWDAFFLEVTSETRRYVLGLSTPIAIPLLTAVGNHESGGYLHADTPGQRNSVYDFYPRVFPHRSKTIPRVNGGSNASTMAAEELVDKTLTFHDHTVGALVTLIILDSDNMIPAKDQTEFLSKSLASAETPIILPFYHHPGHPGYRPFADKQSVQVRRHFLPLLDSYSERIPYAFEHHDHVYKRTVPIQNGEKVMEVGGTTAPGEARGVVYVGDGALGVNHPSRTMDKNRWYIAQASEQNHVLIVTCFMNRTVWIRAVTKEGVVFDEFSR